MDRVFGSYILNERIGVGGMGEVYRATKGGPEGFEVRVAVKLILPHLAREESFRRLFSREARLAALLKHPNIVNVNGFDIHEGTAFIEMEYVEGTDLASLLKHLGDGELLSLAESVCIIHGAARGLAHAHSFGHGSDGGTGVIHRDFNPHNILISIEGEVKITDFGIARAAMGDTAASATVMGKLAYMSPEQVEGKPLDHRSDLFSLGITAYQLFTGEHPFRRASEAGTVRAVQDAIHRPLAETAPSLPSPLAETVESLLSVSPEDRPDTARYVADIFEEFLKPVSGKMLGRRARDTANARLPEPADAATVPTLSVKSKRRLAWPAALTIITAVLFMVFWKIAEPPAGSAKPAATPATSYSPSATAGPAPDMEKVLEEATVRVNTVPPGALVIDGEATLGRTPLAVGIPSGMRSRELTVSLDRYEPAGITLTRDFKESGLTLSLTPLPTGTLRIGAIPWARASIMGEDRGVTPIVMEGAPIGEHILVLSNEELGIRREAAVTIREGVNTVFVMDMPTGKIVQGE